MSGEGLRDRFGRVHRSLRLSVTDRCNIRCSYCMEEDVHYLPRSKLLSYEELARFVRVAVGLGVRKVRITGGEPLVRRDLPVLVRALRAIEGIEDLALTTNGILLAEQAQSLQEAGLMRLNVHLDTLDAGRFEQITRRKGCEKVTDGIRLARSMGFAPLKVNAVARKGFSEPDLVPLAELARDLDIEVRFIEVMPLGADRNWKREDVLFAEDIRAHIEAHLGPMAPLPSDDPSAAARTFTFPDGRGRIGFVASVSQPFCPSCDRIRLTADGKLRNCLFALDEMDVKRLLREGGTDEAIACLIRTSVEGKWEGHEINHARFLQPERPMHAIGG